MMKNYINNNINNSINNNNNNNNSSYSNNDNVNNSFGWARPVPLGSGPLRISTAAGCCTDLIAPTSTPRGSPDEPRIGQIDR